MSFSEGSSEKTEAPVKVTETPEPIPQAPKPETEAAPPAEIKPEENPASPEGEAPSAPADAAPEEAAASPEEKAPEEKPASPESEAPQEAVASPEEKTPEEAPAPADATPAAPPEKKAGGKAKKARRRHRKKQKILDRSAENDIRYRGPLSYRHFRTLAWICLALSQVVFLMRLDQKIEPEYGAVYETPILILSVISSLALPLLLVANFAVILDGREGYVRQTLRYGILAAAAGGGCCLIISRYLLGSLGILIQDPDEASQYLDMLLSLFRPQGYWAFNIFIDLFLCSLFMCLINCRPTRVFTGKRVLILRFLAVIPAAYEIACIVLKIMAGTGRLRLPVMVWPFLTTKPPLTFLVFIFLAFYVKRRERLFRRHDRSHEDFMQHMQTNYNSLRFSLFAARTFFFTALLDLFAVFVLPVLILVFSGQDTAGYASLTNGMINCGFGGSIELLPMIPFMLLFSYTRTYKGRLYDTLLPVFGIGLIFCVWIEGSYQALQLFGTSLPEGFGDMLKFLIMGLAGQP